MTRLILKRGDVVTIKVPFCKLSAGRKGICLGSSQQSNGVLKLSVLLEDERIVDLTGREAQLFFEMEGHVDIGQTDNKNILKLIKNEKITQ